MNQNDLYVVLGVSPKADFSQIKKAFRKRVKELHPDVQGDTEGAKKDIHRLLHAYEILSDPDQRRAYDFTRKSTDFHATFNYRDFLKTRKDDKSQAKLVFYDVLRKREAEAVALYNRLAIKRTFSLEQSLGKEDFMDCAFLLALEMEKAGDLAQAVSLHIRIAELEQERPYFRHFFIEVEDRLRNLLVHKVSWEIPPKEMILLVERILSMEIHQKTRLSLMRKIIPVYFELGQGELGYEKLAIARKEFPKDKTLKKMSDRYQTA